MVWVRGGVCSFILLQWNDQNHPCSINFLYCFPLRSCSWHSVDKAADKTSLSNILCCCSLFDVKVSCPSQLSWGVTRRKKRITPARNSLTPSTLSAVHTSFSLSCSWERSLLDTRTLPLSPSTAEFPHFWNYHLGHIKMWMFQLNLIHSWWIYLWDYFTVTSLSITGELFKH